MNRSEEPTAYLAAAARMAVVPDPSPSAAASKIGHIGYSYYERLRSDPIPPPGSLFRGLLVCPQREVHRAVSASAR